MTAADAFESEFGLTLSTPSELPPEVEGRVENWRPGGITTLARSLALIPANRDTVLRAVRGTRVCVVRDLEFVGVPHDATATEFFSDPVTELVSLDLHIFDPARWEHDLGGAFARRVPSRGAWAYIRWAFGAFGILGIVVCGNRLAGRGVFGFRGAPSIRDSKPEGLKRYGVRY